MKDILDLESIGYIMSNLGHRIEDGAEEKLKAGDVYGEYAASNFWAAVWWENGIFKASIWRYGEYIETLTGVSLQDIMNEASEYYGSW